MRLAEGNGTRFLTFDVPAVRVAPRNSHALVLTDIMARRGLSKWADLKRHSLGAHSDCSANQLIEMLL